VAAFVSLLVHAGDSLVLATMVHSDQDDVVVASKQGTVMRCAAKDIRAMSRTAKGVKLMGLQAGDEVQSLTIMPAEYKTALA
jgi:DNA gyrase/topoisomerase IV subunit A